MKIGIIGGALQGIEAVYLAKKAGYETLVIDRRSNAPAIDLSDEHLVADPTVDPVSVSKAISDCDIVIPANENAGCLSTMDSIMAVSDVPYLFDRNAYDISNSKIRSNDIMKGVGVPMPSEWPECGFPVIVKPSSQSGSVGVSIVWNDEGMSEAIRRIDALGDKTVIQEFVRGKSISIEMIGNGSRSASFVTTEIVLDGGYDCKMVKCGPDTVDRNTDALFKRAGESIADRIGLNGIMDLEAIVNDGIPKMIEIDARIPSQTPIAVLHASDINLLEALVSSKNNKMPAKGSHAKRYSIYEHLTVRDGYLYSNGEKEFSHVGSLRLEKGLFGCDEVLCDYSPGSPEWRGTFISSGSTEKESIEKRDDYIRRILDECDLKGFIDRSPEVY